MGLDADGAFDSITCESYPGIERGLDSWGRRIVLENSSGQARFRSLGPDGIDNDGSGDDIEVVIDYSKYLDKER